MASPHNTTLQNCEYLEAAVIYEFNHAVPGKDLVVRTHFLDNNEVVNREEHIGGLFLANQREDVLISPHRLLLDRRYNSYS